MAMIQWDQTGERRYEAGLDRGVFYPPNAPGVAWNGLTSVEEENNTEIEAVYFDAVKFNDLVTLGEYTANMKAYTYPDEFHPFDGLANDQKGVLIANQVPGRFGLCYRTHLGDDVKNLESGYRIHVVYNLTANSASKNWETLGMEVEPLEFEWEISAIPEELNSHRPTSHVIFDSRELDPWLLQDIEDILYGDEDHDPTLPPLNGFITFIRKWNRLIIEDHGDGTWTATSQSEEDIDVESDGYFEIHAPDEAVVIIDEDTYQISSSEKNDADIYP
jgi:hypothetical protein